MERKFERRYAKVPEENKALYFKEFKPILRFAHLEIHFRQFTYFSDKI